MRGANVEGTLLLIRPKIPKWDIDRKHKLMQNFAFIDSACRTLLIATY